ncbi:MAG: hypothetical protein MUF87_10640 [Anaerolineae bacterium]|jgi:hypothetical protein|nr:hypothetical protein [Anaerolineae bacterium]
MPNKKNGFLQIPRKQLFEFTDQVWFPALFRDLITDGLNFASHLFRYYTPILPRLEALTDQTATIIDLCSGGGGPWSQLIPLSEKKLRVILTDKYPNMAHFEHLRTQFPESIEYRSESIDARQIPPDLEGMVTIFTSFHHFKPEEASQILANMVNQRRVIGIFEITERSLFQICAAPFLIVFGILATTPFIKPPKLSRFLWTYLIPVIPITNVWDGIVSSLRSYTVDELQAMVAPFPEYRWEIGKIESPPFPITYLIGQPNES